MVGFESLISGYGHEVITVPAAKLPNNGRLNE